MIGKKITSQMEQWSILSQVGNYVQYDRNPKDFYDLDDRLKEEDRQVLELDFGNNPDKL